MLDQGFEELIKGSLEPCGALILPKFSERLLLFVAWQGWRDMYSLNKDTAFTKLDYLFCPEKGINFIYSAKWVNSRAAIKILLRAENYERELLYISNGIRLALCPPGSKALALDMPEIGLKAIHTVYPPELNTYPKYGKVKNGHE